MTLRPPPSPRRPAAALRASFLKVVPSLPPSRRCLTRFPRSRRTRRHGAAEGYASCPGVPLLPAPRARGRGPLPPLGPRRSQPQAGAPGSAPPAAPARRGAAQTPPPPPHPPRGLLPGRAARGVAGAGRWRRGGPVRRRPAVAERLRRARLSAGGSLPAGCVSTL